jgi:hypothetical protein
MNKGVNLEQRIKFSSNNRAKDMAKIGLVAAIFGTVALIVGWKIPQKQPCLPNFFTEDEIMCFDCLDFHGD